jgi:A/G-specific adenine glycosylase
VKRAGPAALLLAWYGRNARDLPWRRTNDPYRIWLSEVMLQQTRAAAAIPFYERFLYRFPTLAALAGAEESEVLALWSGLGYYSRARNLLRAARHAATGLPDDFEGLRKLPGVGEYTAAAVASIAFHRPVAVLDGNVLRVVARVEADAGDTGSPGTRERFRRITQAWLDPADPGGFNQALMELGATICLPRNPLCSCCPIAALCAARARGIAEQLPVRPVRREPVQIEAVLVVARRGRRVLLRQRPAASGRMAGFWDLPATGDLPGIRPGPALGRFRHSITHHRYTFAVCPASLRGKPRGGEFRWFDPQRIVEIPLSTTARKGLQIAGILTPRSRVF